jgi:hypothetical protein
MDLMGLTDLNLLYQLSFWAAVVGVADAVLGSALLRLLGRPTSLSTARLGFLIPAIAMAVGAGADYLKSRAANKSAQEQQKLYNEWLNARSAGVNNLVSNLAANGTNVYGPQTSTMSGTTGSVGSSSTSQNQAQTSSSSTAPTISPEFTGLVGSARQLLEGRLAAPSSLPAGYVERAAAGIQAAADPARQTIRNIAARRGVSADVLSLGSPVERQVAGQLADLTASTPLKARELRNEDINMAANLASTFGKGSATTGSATSSGTSRTNSSSQGTTSSSAVTPPNLSELAALLLPPGPQAGTQTGISVAGGGMAGLAQMMATLYGMGAFKPAAPAAPAAA